MCQVCMNCEEEVNRMEMTDTQDGEVCDDCITEYTQCYNCDEYVHDNNIHKLDGDSYCEECFDQTAAFCDCCHGYVHEDDINRADDDWVCDDCLERNYIRCDGCRNHFHESNTSSDGNISLCSSCIEDYYVCDDCEDFVHCDNVYYDDCDNEYCEHCYHQNSHNESEHIHDYGYRPDPNFLSLDTEDSTKLYFGWELEVDDGKNKHDAVNSVNDILNRIDDYVYFKNDGSLNCGFEMVSHPATYQYHMSNKDELDSAFQKLKDRYFKSHNTYTCGYHIHISRNAFNDQEDIAKFVYLIERFYEEILKFSRRTSNGMDRWAKRYGLLPRETPNDLFEKIRGDRARYRIVNMEPRNTIEVRAFKGTLNVNTFIATLQLMKVFYDLAMSFPLSVIVDVLWDEIVATIEDSGKYPELLEYLEKRSLKTGITKHEKFVPKPKEPEKKVPDGYKVIYTDSMGVDLLNRGEPAYVNLERNTTFDTIYAIWNYEVLPDPLNLNDNVLYIRPIPEPETLYVGSSGLIILDTIPETTASARPNPDDYLTIPIPRSELEVVNISSSGVWNVRRRERIAYTCISGMSLLRAGDSARVWLNRRDYATDYEINLNDYQIIEETDNRTLVIQSV